MDNQRIDSCIRNLTGYEGELNENISLNVYGLDSLARVELVISLEDEFGVNFKDCDLTQKNFETIGSIKKLLEVYGVL